MGPYTEKTVSLNQRNISLMYGRRKKCFKIKKALFIQTNFFESTKHSSIQRNFFFDRLSKKLFCACRGLNLK